MGEHLETVSIEQVPPRVMKVGPSDPGCAHNLRAIASGRRGEFAQEDSPAAEILGGNLAARAAILAMRWGLGPVSDTGGSQPATPAGLREDVGASEGRLTTGR